MRGFLGFPRRQGNKTGSFRKRVISPKSPRKKQAAGGSFAKDKNIEAAFREFLKEPLAAGNKKKAK